MPRRRKPPSQSWKTFLENHVPDLASVDFFVVRTVTFRILFVFVVLLHRRRQVVHFNVTDSPTAAWTSRSSRRSQKNLRPDTSCATATPPMVTSSEGA